MEIKKYSLLAAVIVAFVSCISFQSGAQSMAASVNFGQPPVGGGPCTGKGLCSLVAQSANASGISATLEVSPNDNNVLMIIFSLSDLQASQPQQVPYFTSNSRTYTFDGTFDLTDPMFAPLNLAQGASINPSTPNNVVINGDVVTASYYYFHN